MQREVKQREVKLQITKAKELDHNRFRDAVMLRWDSKEPDQINGFKESHTEQYILPQMPDDCCIQPLQRDRSTSLKNPYRQSISVIQSS